MVGNVLVRWKSVAPDGFEAQGYADATGYSSQLPIIGVQSNRCHDQTHLGAN